MGKITEYRNPTTGETAPARRIGETDDGRMRPMKIFRSAARCGEFIVQNATDAHDCWDANDIDGAREHLKQIAEDCDTLARQVRTALAQMAEPAAK